jgi:hypothetical protein
MNMDSDTPDMSEKDKQIDELQNRVDRLEDMVRELLPNRRDVLKFGGAAAVGAVALSGTGAANAGTNNGEVGTIGASGSKVDLFLQDIEGLETINSDNLVTTSETTDYDVQKDGSDASGVINFKTS